MTKLRLQIVYGFFRLSIGHHWRKGNEPVERYCQEKNQLMYIKEIII